MSRSRIGLILLLVLLAAALLGSSFMVHICTEDSSRLLLASEEALRGNWEAAAYHTAQVRRSWDRWEFFRCAMADHTPAEEIDALFAVLEVYGTSREKTAFAAVCREASQKLKAMGEAHRLNLHNLL